MMQYTEPKHGSSTAVHGKTLGLSIPSDRLSRKPKPAKQNLDFASHLRREICFICGTFKCTLMSHRLATLEVLHRISKRTKTKANDHGQPIRYPCKRDDAECNDAGQRLNAPRLPIRPASQLHGWPDPFATFPINKITNGTGSVIRQFNDFMRQGGELRHGQRSLAFDSGHYSWLLPQAMQNTALFMSTIAMSATYTAVHGRMLDTPDAAVLATYTRAYQELQRQVDNERSKKSRISESTIMAAINLVMCCGIGFGDWDLALVHWTGVRAFVPDSMRTLYSGVLLGFISALEHWLALTTGLKPRHSSWPVALRLEHPLQEVYGSGLHKLVEIPGLQDAAQTWRILEIAENTCRATEILEKDSREFQRTPQSQQSPYFIYLRGVLGEQSALAHAELNVSNTLEECIVTTLSIFYSTVLRMTPWKAPLLHLCAQLRRAISGSGVAATCQSGRSLSDSAHACFPESHFSQSTISILYVWMLFVCAHAARLCRDESTLQWSLHCLQEALATSYCSKCDRSAWQQDLLNYLEAFCWSRVFLKSHFMETCQTIMLPSRDEADTLNCADVQEQDHLND